MAQDRILWSDRDIGQKFSMIMFGIVQFAFAVFMVFTAFRAIKTGEWWLLVLSLSMLVTAVSYLIGWSRRNAR